MLKDRKITSWAQPVSSLADEPQMSAAALKAAFDSNTNELKPALNGMIDDLTGTGGAGNVGTSPIDGVTGTDVQTMLAFLKGLIDLCDPTENVDNKLALKADKAVTDKHIKTVGFNGKTGVFTFTREDGTSQTLDTMLEKVPVRCYLDGQTFVLVLEDGTEQRADLSAFLTKTEFTDSGTIDFAVSGETVTASVKAGSITLSMLEKTVMSTLQGYMTAAQTAAGNAKTSEINAAAHKDAAAKSASASAQSAAESAGHAKNAQSWAVGGTNSRPGEDTDNAKYYAKQAGASADDAARQMTAASASAAEARESAAGAAGSALAAKSSETAAAGSASKAKASETAAASSAAAAKTSQDAAKTSETNAAASASTAKTSQTAAKTSETNAAGSASAAKVSETAAKTSQGAAKTSETNAAGSASAAKASQNAAKLSETNAANSATAAEKSRQAIEDMTVKAQTLSPGADATVSKRTVGGAVELTYGIPKGEKGDTGMGLTILGYYASLSELQSKVPAPTVGHAYGIGTAAPYDIYIWDGKTWVNNGKLQGAKGDKGENGAPGATGSDGAPGKDGGYYKPAVSANGDLSWTASGSGMPAVGTVNIRGPKGADGAPGVAGKSAFQSARENGYTGSEAEFYAALVAMKDGPFLPLKGGKMDDDAFISCKNLAFTTQAIPGAAGDHTLDIYLSEDRHGSGSKIFDMQLSSPYVFKEFGIDANDEETIFLEQTTMDDGKTNGLKIGLGIDGVSLYAGKTKTFDGVGIRAAGEKVELVNSKILWPESIVNKEYVDGFAPKYTKITLTASGWDSSAKTQKVTVAGVLADETKQLIMPMPAMASQNDYAAAGIACTLQEANALTFKCQTVPTKDIVVFVTVQEVAG